MKKKLTALLAVLLLSGAFAGCGLLGSTSSSLDASNESSSSTEQISSTESSVQSSVESSATQYLYTAFTATEKALFYDWGEELPLIANNEYYVEEYTYTYNQTIETGIYFYTVGNTEEEFNAYKDLLDETYRFYQMQVEENGKVWYFYHATEYSVRIIYGETEKGYGVHVFAYTVADWDPAPPQSSEDSSVDSSVKDSSTDSSIDSSVKDSSTDSSAEDVVGGVYTLSFDNLSYRTQQTDEVQVWDNGKVKLTNNKADSSQPINGQYYDPIRLYAGTNAVIECEGMRKIEFLCDDFKADYVTELERALNELRGVTVWTKGQVVTVEFNTKQNSITISFAKQVRLNSLTVYTGNSDVIVVPPENSTDSSTNSSADDMVDGDVGEILLTLYGLKDGESLTGEFTLTGKIISLDGYDNPTIEVEGFENMPVYCYRLQLPDASVGDIITVTATTMKNYQGTYEFMNCTLVENLGGGTVTNVDLITNAGKGLPTGANGVYDIDFTKATYAKNVTEQGYYIDGCPTLSTDEYNPSVLVIPVEFSDVTAASKGYTVSAIKAAFNGSEGETDYYSVHDYYYVSSYGQLDLNITVLDNWFRPKYTSSYYASATIDYYGQEIFGGDQMILDEALAYLSESMDLALFDADGNTCIDAVVLINTLDIDSESDFQWAYRYWNVYTDAEGYYFEYDGVSANDYLWASYQFLLEAYDEEENVYYDDSVRNTYTYIHEFGHILGADDYYDYAGVNEPMAGCDIMDYMLGDHNAYTKFNYGWLTSSRLIVAEESVTLSLEAFDKNGDTIIIANNWDDDLGVYQEYYIVVYYTKTGLNGTVDGVEYGYFARDGIVVYHVNASLYGEDYGDGTIYYDVYNNNTDDSDSSGTADNLIEYVKSPNDTFTYIEGDSLSSSLKDDMGNKIAYTFTVDSLTADSATLTFTKN